MSTASQRSQSRPLRTHCTSHITQDIRLDNRLQPNETPTAVRKQNRTQLCTAHGTQNLGNFSMEVCQNDKHFLHSQTLSVTPQTVLGVLRLCRTTFGKRRREAAQAQRTRNLFLSRRGSSNLGTRLGNRSHTIGTEHDNWGGLQRNSQGSRSLSSGLTRRVLRWSAESRHFR